MVWLRIDVDNPCYYHPIYTRLRLRRKIPIPGYYRPTRETMPFLRSKFPQIKRRWFIRSMILPPKDLFNDEEIGVHITNPMNAWNEYSTVASWFGRKIQYYTRHGRAKIASGPAWTSEQVERVHRDLSGLEDLTDKPHIMITRLSIPPSELDYTHLDHILFHPVHFRIAHDELEQVLRLVSNT
jgi:hypothetical protein